MRTKIAGETVYDDQHSLIRSPETEKVEPDLPRQANLIKINLSAQIQADIKRPVRSGKEGDIRLSRDRYAASVQYNQVVQREIVSCQHESTRWIERRGSRVSSKSIQRGGEIGPETIREP